LEPPQTKERAGSNPGFFYIPLGGCCIFGNGNLYTSLAYSSTPAIFLCVFFGKQSERKQNASNFDDVLMWF
jgi:hypothetical protein